MKTLHLKQLSAVLLLGLSSVATAKAAPAASPMPVVDAPSGAYRADLDHSSVVFRVKHLGMAWFTARFTAVQTELTFDASAPEKSAVTVSIDPTTVRTGVAPGRTGDFDNQVASDAKLLNAGAFPRITFRSVRVERTGPATAHIFGDLTLLGVTRPVTLDAVFNGSLKAHPFSKKPVLGFSATGAIKRSDFGMTYLIPSVGDDVQIIVEAEFVAK